MANDGCVKPTHATCPLSNSEPDASGWGQVQQNKKRLIDANALMDEFRAYMVERYDREKCFSEENCKTCDRPCLWWREVNEAPTVDAVEVVRCKDCKFCRTFYPIKEIDKEAIQVWYCDLYRCNRKPDEFCSDGERREGE